jgi:hypothetical protein
MSAAALWCYAGLYRALTFPRRIDEVNEQGNHRSRLRVLGGPLWSQSVHSNSTPLAPPSVEFGMASVASIFLVLLGYNLLFLLP